jgi:uncharacterized ferredoxin-like protein
MGSIIEKWPDGCSIRETHSSNTPKGNPSLCLAVERLALSGFNELEKPFRGPNCIIKMADLGIALGSAAKTASMHNVDNRIMFTAGVAALSLGWMEGCLVAYGLPLKASGKSIYFDRPANPR